MQKQNFWESVLKDKLQEAGTIKSKAELNLPIACYKKAQKNSGKNELDIFNQCVEEFQQIQHRFMGSLEYEQRKVHQCSQELAKNGQTSNKDIEKFCTPGVKENVEQYYLQFRNEINDLMESK
ncbi:hypothetical protein PPERSA_04832 [Pseudocohnilembus persalinus]|uniref:Uncharacterized protein n=1 Tax=Pseudocohnilembus persalinus TaxID=266149 RepID=A0A0V0QJ02_PSEPJ|nr:hypothetical protein PPERSA_04832 [Pseudocohnilembus persalinus]|eukprot:KRX02210.1 hypothetical protein PPERSA_04832 [Pseudocohnilembus persalinus]